MKIARLLALSLGLLLLAGACSDDDAVTTTIGAEETEDDAVTTTIGAEETEDDAVTTTVGAEYNDDELSRIEEAETRARAYAAAVNQGRVDEMSEIVGVPLGEADLRHFEFHSILNSAGTQWNLGECEVRSVSASVVNLECEHSYSEPVFVAVGAGESIWPFTLLNEQLISGSWISLGNDFTEALHAYRDYMKTFHPDDYTLCDPLEQTGQFSQHGGIARVPECAPAMIEHSEAVIEWIEAGKPTE